MGRLPNPGQDEGVWGSVLNEYLQVSHDNSGAIKPGVVAESNLTSSVRTKLNQTPTVNDGTITEAKLASALQTKIDGKADSAALATVATTGSYNDLSNKPTGPSLSTTDDLPEGTVNKYFTNARASAAAPVQSVNTRSGAVVLTKTDVSLDNVDNTSDANKPVSNATQTSLNTKANLAGAAFTGSVSVNGTLTTTGTVNGRVLATDGTKLDGIQAGAQVNAVTTVATRTGDVVLTKADVGLDSVDNTTDLGKPISTATQTALNAKAATSSLAAVATSGSYADVTNKPLIVLGPSDPVPGGTAAGTVIIRKTS